MTPIHMLSLGASLAIVGMSLFISAVYTIRVARNSKDPLRWALLGVLLTVGLTNLPALIFYTWGEGSPPLWLGYTTRILGTGVLLVVAWPLLRDTWREVCAWCRVAIDSWRFLWNRRY